ncbi:uncharacterized protein JCM6883_000483 [Sporobolomyces salmoneus]|uniref:uncharacterized protein n=1 Tax=Sporobolomyces salmoneus TaxID=183962 RepID=UPI003176DF27
MSQEGEVPKDFKASLDEVKRNIRGICDAVAIFGKFEQSQARKWAKSMYSTFSLEDYSKAYTQVLPPSHPFAAGYLSMRVRFILHNVRSTISYPLSDCLDSPASLLSDSLSDKPQRLDWIQRLLNVLKAIPSGSQYGWLGRAMKSWKARVGSEFGLNRPSRTGLGSWRPSTGVNPELTDRIKSEEDVDWLAAKLSALKKLRWSREVPKSERGADQDGHSLLPPNLRQYEPESLLQHLEQARAEGHTSSGSGSQHTLVVRGGPPQMSLRKRQLYQIAPCDQSSF